MKKVLFLAALALGMSSCQKEDAAVIGTGTVKFKPIVEKSIDFTKKSDVNRGEIPVYVDGINVSTTGVLGTQNTTFNLVDDNSGADEFIIENLPLGETTIEANTTTNSASVHTMKSFATVVDAVADAKAMNPYAIYNSVNPVVVELKHLEVATANIDMATNNGRVFMTFSPESTDLLASYDVKVTANNGVEEHTSNLTMANPTVLYYWSNKDAVAGAKTDVTIEWFVKGESLVSRTETFSVEVEAAMSYKYNIIIANSSVELGKVGLSFNFTPVEEVDKGDIIFGGEEFTTMEEVTVADWDLATGAFIAETGQAFKWTREDAAGHYNLAAAVYFSADWNAELKVLAKNSVIDNVVNENAPRGWDLLIYDDYTNSDVFDIWIANYGTDGVLNAEKLRNDYYYYDALGVVIGMYRAKEAGVMTQEKYDASIAVATARIAELGGITKVKHHATFKMIFDETGENLGVTPDATLDVAEMRTWAQDLGFAARAYGVDGITDLTEEELRVALLEAAANTEYSLPSIDAINGYYSL